GPSRLAPGHERQREGRARDTPQQDHTNARLPSWFVRYRRPFESVKERARMGNLVFHPKMQPRRKTVIVVDDDEGTRETLTAILRSDYRVLRAASGEAALTMMEREDVDVMLL